MENEMKLSQAFQERLERLLMLRFGSFTRRVVNTWINPMKSRGFYEDERRVFFRDESPEGLYPAFVVPEKLLQEIVVVTPLKEFMSLLDGWKQANPELTKRFVEIVKKDGV